MEGKNIKKTTKISGIILAIVLILMISVYWLFQTPAVQHAIVNVITKNIAEQTGADVSISKVNIRFFRSLVIDDVFLSDQNKDTLFYTEKIVAKVDTLKFFSKRVHFKEIQFKNPQVNITHKDSAYNFDFLLNGLPKDTLSTPSVWKMYCQRFEIKNGTFNYDDSALSDDVQPLLHINSLNLIVDSTHFRNMNQLALNFEKFNCSTQSGLSMENLKVKIDYRDSVLTLNGLQAETKNSEIDLPEASLNFKKYFSSNKLIDLKYNINLANLKFSLSDISFLLDDSFDNSITTNLSGKIQGDFSDIRGKDIHFAVEKFTNLSGDFYLNGVQDLNTLYVFANLNESYANLKEIRNLDLPPAIERAITNLPDIFDNVGTFSYKGNFTGFLDDFVAYGTAYSNLGTISSDISFRPGKNDVLNIQGSISTDSLDVGTIFDNDKLNKLSLKGEVKGTLNANSEYDLDFVGRINAVDFNNYRFTQIDMNGNIRNKQFNGMFSIADPNLKMNYMGVLDLSPELPVFEFVAEIDRANLDKLHLTTDKRAILRMKVNANFEGNSIDNVNGYLALSNVRYHNTKGKFNLDSIVLNNTFRNDSNLFVLRSDILDGELVGHYNLMNIGSSLIAYYQQYLPSSYYSYISEVSSFNDFKYHFHVKDIYPVIKVFKPELYVEPNFEIEGNYNPQASRFSFDTDIPLVRFENKDFENVRISVNANSEQIATKVKTDKIGFGSNLNLYNFSINSAAYNDTLAVNLYWNNFEESTYSGKLKTITSFQKTDTDYPSIVTKIESSNVYFGDSLWVMDDAIVSIDSSAIEISKLNFHHNDQRFWVDGKIANNKTDHIKAKIENVDFELFEPFIGKSYFTGKINGEASIADFYEKMMLDLDLSVDNFCFDGGYLGEFNLDSKWDNKNDQLVSKINLIKNKENVLEAYGNIDPLHNSLDMKLRFDNTPVSILQVFMPTTFNNQFGLIDGDIHLYGKFLHIMHDGVLTPVSDAGMGLAYLNTNYVFRDPVWFSNDSILFKELKFYDKDGNSGILDGSIRHETFFNMSYDLNVKSNRMLVMNTTIAQNDAFYGVAYASSDNFNISGFVDNILLSGSARSEKGTNLYIPMESEENAEVYDFIEFVNKEIKKEEKPAYNVVTSGLEMDFDLDITPEAKVQIIIDSQSGTVIKGSGTGSLQFKVDRNYNIGMYGDYTIDEGEVLLTLQNLINKRFSIEPGGTIEWIGDPYAALLDIKAIYKVKTSLSDLFVDDYLDIDLSRRVPVDCGIRLTESLMSPRIDFTISLPTVEERVRDEVSQLMVTQEDVNKQIISLLMLGRFYTPEFFAGKQSTNTGADFVGSTVGTTASELLSNSLSNWLSQMTDFIDFGVNFRPGNEYTANQLELALSTQILNDRLTIDGNVANNVNQSTNNNGQFINNFDINYKLTDNGRFQLKAYNHANDKIMYETAGYTQGVGISYREEFNSFRELIERFKEAVLPDKRKKKNSNKVIAE